MTHHEVVKNKGRTNEIASMHLNSLRNGQRSENSILRGKEILLKSKEIFLSRQIKGVKSLLNSKSNGIVLEVVGY